jgi:hypothetical protein
MRVRAKIGAVLGELQPRVFMTPSQPSPILVVAVFIFRAIYCCPIYIFKPIIQMNTKAIQFLFNKNCFLIKKSVLLPSKLITIH